MRGAAGLPRLSRAVKKTLHETGRIRRLKKRALRRPKEVPPLKLNMKRTLLVGLAFLSICAFWEMYDFTTPLVLKNTYHLGDTWAGVVMAMDNVLALFLLPFFGALSDKCHTRIGRRMPFILGGTAAAVALILLMPVVIANYPLGIFLLLLGLLLLAMGIYRSPAVALMPDVTPKPLRSKGNAVINLMGALGGLITLILTRSAIVTTVNAAGDKVSDYRYIYYAVAALMAVCILVLYLTIRENELTAEMERIRYGETEETRKAIEPAGTGKLRPEVRRSLVLILCSVALWFMGYNAVTTAFSKYAIAVWNTQEGGAATIKMLPTVIAILSYWPVGMYASRFGRRKTILSGVVLLTVCFAAAALFRTLSPVLYVLFALVGVAWAAINVNSLPMVVELATGADTGKYTGFYYTFSMAAQVVTPILSGALLEHVGYHTLFPYAALMVAGSFVTMFFVRHGDSRPEAKHGLEALDAGD